MARFKTVSLSPEQRELLQDYLDWAAKLAAKEHKRLGNSAIDPDLCIVAAEDGLVEAAEKLEGRNGASFKTYGRTVIE